MTPPSGMYRLTASTIANYFKHRCDRLFRWGVVHTSDREQPGIGWNVPRRVRDHSRPGISLLMEAGNDFEMHHVEALRAEVGDDYFVWAGSEPDGNKTVVASLPIEDFLVACRRDPLPRYIAQVKIDAGPGSVYAAGLLKRFGLETTPAVFGSAKPDLIEVEPIPDQPGRAKLRIWDFKASQKARHDHFIQVAFYSFLLEEVLRVDGLDHLEVNTASAVIRSQQEEPEVFELEPYRLALRDFLRNRVPLLLNMPAADAHFHFQEKCVLCEYAETCREESDRTYDLSRIPYISSESKRHLRDMGIRSHRQLARLDADQDAVRLNEIREASHDLGRNLDRYIAAACALEDGIHRPLEAQTLQMPQYEDIRIVLTAEQDAVTGTCFALGIKTYEGWDTTTSRTKGIEQVVIADKSEHEEQLLLDFLRVFNGVLLRVDAQNRAITDQPIDDEPDIKAAKLAMVDAEVAKQTFRQQWPRIPTNHPQKDVLKSELNALDEDIKDRKQKLKQTEREVKNSRQRAQQRLHCYIYDQLDVLVLKGALERHLFTSSPELLAEITTLIRLFPSESVLADADTFRTIPGTVVTSVLRALVALPTPYQYDLRSVSERFPAMSAGVAKGFMFRPRYGFGWEHSNQVAFERIHDVWKNQPFVTKSRTYKPTEILGEIQTTVLAKLRATDSVVRRLKQDYGDRLRLRKEPFRLFDNFNPLSFQTFEALRIFTLLEAALGELAVKQRHTLPIKDRVATFECLSNLRYISEEENTGFLWFSFDSAGKDTKWEAGEFNVVLTPEDRPEVLLGEIDGDLFGGPKWKHAQYQVTIKALDLISDPPRVLLEPKNPAKLREAVDFTKPCVLDPIYTDYNSPSILETLSALEGDPVVSSHIRQVLDEAQNIAWKSIAVDTHLLETDLPYTRV